ncbi:lysozyme inhibitor LprI family protein [Pseudomonas syringae]
MPAHAECVNSDTSREVDACAKTEKNTADARLNDSYKKLIARAKGQYRSDTMGDDFSEAKRFAARMAKVA